MPNVNTLLPFAAHTGDRPYIFISYAHSDAGIVHPEIQRMNQMGYRIWFDDSIGPGKEWSEEIACALEKCTQFIVFITQQATKSRDVRNEISYALRKNKPFLPIHLEKTELPSGIALQLSGIQAIHKWQMDEQTYLHKLKISLPRIELAEQIYLPDGFELVSGAEYAPLDVLALGSREAQERQRDWVTNGYPLEVQMEKTGIPFRLVPPGEFLMGASEDEEGSCDSERPQHKLRFFQPFYVGKFQVTQREWKAVMEGENHSFFRGDNLPVENVSWVDCQKFLKKVGGGLRLPTEPEWEYACRAGTVTRFYTGDSVEDLTAAGWHGGNSGGKTQPVGLKRANAWGLHDMHGNVWEWCQNLYGKYPYSATGGMESHNSTDYRVLRGGTWYGYGSPDCYRSACRYFYASLGRSASVGFRVVMDLSS